MDSRVTNQLVVIAAQAISEKEPGTVITHAWMSNEINAKVGSSVYYRMVSLVRHKLEKSGIFLKTKHTHGYEIALPVEQIGLCEGEYIKGIKIQGRAVAKANHIAYDKLEEGPRNDAIQRTQKMANILTMVERSLPMPKSEN